MLSTPLSLEGVQLPTTLESSLLVQFTQVLLQMGITCAQSLIGGYDGRKKMGIRCSKLIAMFEFLPQVVNVTLVCPNIQVSHLQVERLVH